MDGRHGNSRAAGDEGSLIDQDIYGGVDREIYEKHIADLRRNTAAAKQQRSGRPKDDAFFGCSMWWLRQVLPVVHGARQLAVAQYLWRLRVVRRSKTVTVGNSKLLSDLGVNRFTKARTLRRLERAGLIRVKRHGKAAPVITFIR